MKIFFFFFFALKKKFTLPLLRTTCHDELYWKLLCSFFLLGKQCRQISDLRFFSRFEANKRKVSREMLNKTSVHCDLIATSNMNIIDKNQKRFKLLGKLDFIAIAVELLAKRLRRKRQMLLRKPNVTNWRSTCRKSTPNSTLCDKCYSKTSTRSKEHFCFLSLLAFLFHYSFFLPFASLCIEREFLSGCWCLHKLLLYLWLRSGSFESSRGQFKEFFFSCFGRFHLFVQMCVDGSDESYVAIFSS